MFSSIDKGLTTDAEHDRKARELEDGDAIRNADTAVATASETKAPEAESKAQDVSKKTVSDDASHPALGSA